MVIYQNLSIAIRQLTTNLCRQVAIPLLKAAYLRYGDNSLGSHGRDVLMPVLLANCVGTQGKSVQCVSARRYRY